MSTLDLKKSKKRSKQVEEEKIKVPKNKMFKRKKARLYSKELHREQGDPLSTESCHFPLPNSWACYPGS